MFSSWNSYSDQNETYKCLHIETATSLTYGVLGIRPIQQELDIRKLTLLGNVLLNKNTLEYEIAQRQLAVKSIDSKSCVVY